MKFFDKKKLKSGKFNDKKIIHMACNRALNTSPSKPPVLKYFNSPLPTESNFSLLTLQLEMTAPAFFTHGRFQQAHVHISELL